MKYRIYLRMRYHILLKRVVATFLHFLLARVFLMEEKIADEEFCC